MRIAFVGMGEAGSALVTGWGDRHSASISAYDIKTDRPETADILWQRYERLGIAGAATIAEALAGADLVFSTVTADQAVEASSAAAPHLKQGACFCDLNSVAPSSKRTAAGTIEAAGGRYVDVAVMAPVHPKLNMVPLLISGPHAADIAPVLESLPLAPRVVEGEVGAASAIKMIRSVMIKGIEALTGECILAAAAAGVEEEVVASLAASHGDTDWRRRLPYNLERMMVHGARRAAEMEEVAKTLRDLGLPDDMAQATIGWQRRVADAGMVSPDEDATLGAFTGPLLEALRR